MTSLGEVPASLSPGTSKVLNRRRLLTCAAIGGAAGAGILSGNVDQAQAVSYAILGSDGTVGGPGGSPLSPSVSIVSSPNHFTRASQFDGPVGIGVAPGTFSPFDYVTTETQYNVGRPIAMHIGTDVEPTRMVSQYTDFHGIDNVLTSHYNGFDGTQTVRLYPFESNGEYYGSGHIAQIVSVYGYGNNMGSGTVNEITNFRSLVNNQGSGTVTLSRGFYVGQPINGGGGRIGTFAGLYMENLDGVAGTTFAIYSLGGRSYHAGSIAFGAGNTGSPAAVVDIRPGSNLSSLYIKPYATQTADHVTITDTATNKLLRIVPVGVFKAPALNMDWYQGSDLGATSLIALRSTPGTTPLWIKQAPAQTADLVQIRDSSGNLKARVNRNAYLTVLQNAGPTDAEIVAGEVAFWLDPTNGACKMMFKAKETDGTVRTGSVALS